jgi:hypothetical protein
MGIVASGQLFGIGNLLNNVVLGKIFDMFLLWLALLVIPMTIYFQPKSGLLGILLVILPFYYWFPFVKNYCFPRGKFGILDRLMWWNLVLVYHLAFILSVVAIREVFSAWFPKGVIGAREHLIKSMGETKGKRYTERARPGVEKDSNTLVLEVSQEDMVDLCS